MTATNMAKAAAAITVCAIAAVAGAFAVIIADIKDETCPWR